MSLRRIGAVTEHGDVLTWGGGRFWQLGHAAASQDESVPRRVAGLAGVAQASRKPQVCLKGAHGAQTLRQVRVLLAQSRCPCELP